MTNLALSLLPSSGDAGGGISILLFQILAIGLVFYFLIIRPQSRARKQHQELLGSLKTGDEVITNGGIMGKVKSIKDEKVTIESGTSTIVVRRDRIVQVGDTPAPGASR